MVKIGQAVIYVDSRGRERPALVTNVWDNMSGTGHPGTNVVFVNDDVDQTDSYGRKIERSTSVVHQSNQPAHGNFWKEVS